MSNWICLCSTTAKKSFSMLAPLHARIVLARCEKLILSPIMVKSPQNLLQPVLPATVPFFASNPMLALLDETSLPFNCSRFHLNRAKKEATLGSAVTRFLDMMSSNSYCVLSAFFAFVCFTLIVYVYPQSYAKLLMCAVVY